jgi:hypothetical protein
MKCPHCHDPVGFIKLLKQSLPFAGKALEQGLSPDRKGAIEEELYCGSCHNRIYIGIRPAMVFLGLLLAAFGLLKLGRSLIKASKYGLSAYIILSLFAVIIYSLRLQKKPGTLNAAQRSYKRAINFALAAVLPLLVVIQIGFFYCSLIPSKTDLKKISGTISHISYHRNGFPDYIVLKNQAHDNRFYFTMDENSAGEWQLKEKLSEAMDVRLLADDSKNIFYPEGACNIWEIASNQEVLIPYEAIRQVWISRAKAENWEVAQIVIFFFSGYLVTLYLVKKEENTTKNNRRKGR